jgi:hypothetical protein
MYCTFKLYCWRRWSRSCVGVLESCLHVQAGCGINGHAVWWVELRLVASNGGEINEPANWRAELSLIASNLGGPWIWGALFHRIGPGAQDCEGYRWIWKRLLALKLKSESKSLLCAWCGVHCLVKIKDLLPTWVASYTPMCCMMIQAV